MSSDQNCLFCRIVAGLLPAAKVYEDDQVLAFMNLQQVQPGHTLIIPKSHFANIFEISENTLRDLAGVSARIAKAAKIAFNAEGVQMLQNNGPEAWQTVMHYHQHVIPRYKGDVGQNLFSIWTKGQTASPQELEANASKIRAALKD